VRRFGGVAGLLEHGHLKEADRDYLARASRVVPPVTDIPVAVPQGRREAYPVDAERVVDLAARYRLDSSFERLLQALPKLGVSQ
jgi:hypothetical protein